MKKAVFLILVLLSSCKEYAPYEVGKFGFEKTAIGLMEEAINSSHNNTPGISMSVRCDEKNIDWKGVVGYDGKDKKNELDVEQPFRIASITKTFVAVAILKLHELDSISVNDPLSKYISQKHQSILKQDGYDLDKISILHCLNHTSGLFDYAMGGSPYGEFVKQDPQHRWTRTEQLSFALEHGDKLGYPGEKYAYSDTGYILLGEIIGLFFDGDLALGLRSLINYEKLGMNLTWLESLEEAPQTILRPVRRYFQGSDATGYDPSTDLYGGGGIMSTIGDLSIFLHAVFNGQVFEKESTMALMLEAPQYDESYDTSSDRRFKDYRQGLWKVKINNQDVYMHSGLWGTHVLHQPESNTTVALNFTYGGSDRLIKKAFMAVHSKTEKN